MAAAGARSQPPLNVPFESDQDGAPTPRPARLYNGSGMPLTVPCPTCKKPVDYGTTWFPFCSDRCRLIDIGRWHDEEYRIPVASQPSESSARPEGGDESE